MRFRFIAAEKAQYSLSRLCGCLQVTRSGFYAWRRRPESGHAQRDRQLKVLVHASFAGSKQRYGSPRIHRDLVEQRERVSRKRVVRLMQEEGLQARVRKRFICTTMSDHDQPVAANVLNRQFTADAPNQRWVGDTTEFGIGESGKLYLAAVLDLFSRFIVGWAVSAVNDRHLTIKALEMALKRRGPGAGLLHHSDQGCTYASEDYQAILDAQGITCSMSRRGNCYDNAVMEAFFSSLKNELADRFASCGDAKMALFDYIEVFYNQRRRHSTIGYVSPAAFERQARLDGTSSPIVHPAAAGGISTASVNRTLAILRHAINWGRGRTPPIFTTSPFHRFGVKIKTKGETKRDRRVGHDEEQRLLAAADKLDCAEHGFAGPAMRDRIVGALETGCRLGEMLKIQNRHVIWSTHQISIPAEHAKDAESRRIPFEPKGRLAQLLKRRRFLGANGYAFGTPTGQYQGTIRTAWESLVLLAHGIEPTRTRARGRVNREQLAEIDLHWHDLRHEAACRWLSRSLDLRAIQLLLGHADLKTTQRYLNVTDEELRKTMQQKLWSRKS